MEAPDLPNTKNLWDRVSPICILLLAILGISAIHSAQLSSDGHQWRGQIFWFLLGSIVYFLAARTDYCFFLRHSHWIYLFSIGAILLLWTPLGIRRYGALRWVSLGPLRFQPEEVVKMSLIISISATLARSKIGKFRESIAALGRVSALFIPPWILIVLQPDLGSALILGPIFLGLLYISNLTGRFFTLLFTGALLLMGLLVVDVLHYCNYLKLNDLTPTTGMGQYEKLSFVPLKDYQRNRLIAFVAPEIVDPQGTGISWNLRQSLISIGSGGFWGKGKGKGTQAQLGYLPKSVSTNDFVFSVLGEERGFLGSALAVTLLFILCFNTLRIAGQAHDRAGRCLAVGIALFFLVHITINVGMTLGLLPITGVPLPFLSYGGSFLIVCCFLQGIVQSIYLRRRNLG